MEGLPEIAEGDDLGELISDSVELEDADVVVVSQKVVSKVEGRVVRLDAVEPSAAAIELAGGHDPRHLEVILRESARVVRSRPPLVIAETRHGFVCANAGVDASNVGPGSGQAVTLLPRDPDASAARIRAAVRGRLGVDLPVVVSDSFGRPWRWGIVDVAIGISGLLPLEDLRGHPDADGRPMRVTVRAVADEIASAAELALGKATRRPAALVRGAEPPLGEGRIADLLMDAASDLFR